MSALPPAGWHPDPTGRCELRYWDGTTWTDEVIRAGFRTTDSLEEARSEHEHLAAAGAGTMPAPPKPASRRRWLPWVIVGIVIVVVVGATVAVFAARLAMAVKAPADEANRYLALLKVGDDAAAYGRVCSSVRHTVTEDQFAEALNRERAAAGPLERYYVHGSTVSGAVAIVRFKATTAKGSYEQEAKLVRERGAWHWCGARPAGRSSA